VTGKSSEILMGLVREYFGSLNSQGYVSKDRNIHECIQRHIETEMSKLVEVYRLNLTDTME
jgi:hypothetical protein